MKIYSLRKFLGKGQEKRFNAVIDLARRNQKIKLAIKCDAQTSIWEFDYDAVDKVRDPYFLGVWLSPSLEGSKIDVDDKVIIENGYLVLAEDQLGCLRDAKRIWDCRFQEIILEDEEDGSAGIYTPTIDMLSNCVYVFVTCKPDKSDSFLKVEDLLRYGVSKESLELCVDLPSLNKGHREELVKAIPKLVDLSPSVQEKLRIIPDLHKNSSERLHSVVAAYTKFWGDISVDEFKSQKSVSKVSKKARIFLENEFNHYKLEEEKKVGKNLLDTAKICIVPDYVQSETFQLTHQISKGVPLKLWILLCASEFFWRDVDREDPKTHPENARIENVLKLINNPQLYYSCNCIEEDREAYDTFLNTYPEIKDFFDVSFDSRATSAASILRPTWAYSSVQAKKFKK